MATTVFNSDKSVPLADVEASPPVMVYVTAPSKLPEGYKFEAELKGETTRTFTVVVPSGGVNEGQEFLAPVPAEYCEPSLNVPTGQWKDSLFSCFRYGILHQHFCCAVFCTQLAMAQVMTRLNLTWLGEPGPGKATKNTYHVILTLVISYIIYSLALEIAAPASDSPLYEFLKELGNIIFTAYAVYALMKTRYFVRTKYSIPESRCIGCEDFCCAFFCSCCTVAQMARHTGEYEKYPAALCSETGHIAGVPVCV